MATSHRLQAASESSLSCDVAVPAGRDGFAPMRRRLLAVVALVVGAASLALAVAVVISEFPRGLIVVGLRAGGRRRSPGTASCAAERCASPGSSSPGSRSPRRSCCSSPAGPPARAAAWSSARSWRSCAARAAFGVARGPAAARRRRSSRCCSSTRSPAAARRSSSRWRDEARARGIEPIELGPAVGPRAARARRGRRRRRRARDGRRRRLAGDRRRDRRRARPARTPASRRARATTSRSTSASTATTSSARSTRSSTAASAASTSPRSTGACSSTTSRSGSTPRRSSARATATRSCGRCSTRCPTCSAPTASGLDLRWTGPGRPRAPLRRRDPRLQQPLPARPRGRLRHAPADRRRPARDHRRRAARRPRRRTAAGRSARGASGRAPAFEVDADAPGRPPASTARRSCSTRRCGSASAPASCACASRAAHPGASPSAALPEGLAASAAPGRLAAIATRPRRRAIDDSQRNHEGATDGHLLESEQKERLSREEVAARLRRLADMLARHNDIEFERGGMRFNVHVPDEVDLKIELEVETRRARAGDRADVVRRWRRVRR